MPRPRLPPASSLHHPTCTCPLTATNSPLPAPSPPPPPRPYNPSGPECGRGGRPSSTLDSTKALIRGRTSLRTSTTLAFSVGVFEGWCWNFFFGQRFVWRGKLGCQKKNKKIKKIYIRDVNTASPNLRLTFSSSNTTCSAGT